MKLLLVDEEIIAGGVETLRFQLLPELARLCESVVWALPEFICAKFRERLRGVPNLVLESLSAPSASAAGFAHALARRLPRGLAGRLTRRLLEARVRTLARRHGSTHALTTCVFNQPLPRLALPIAGFVCDVNPALPEATRRNILRWVREADATFGISEFTCAELRRQAPECAAKIHPIPLAAPPFSAPATASDPRFDFYFPAAPNPHKAHATLFAACLQLAQRGLDFRLALSGPGIAGFRPGGSFADPRMDAARRFLAEHAALLDPRIVVCGDVPPEKVEALFNGARCVVLPSTYEGFGLPLVEVLRRGSEIICTDIPPFREQLERYDSFDRARLVATGDATQLAAAMEQQLRAPLPPLPREKLDARLARWAWPDAARRCFDLLAALSP
jgi:glycosyltransferase involved in cell wall biosynthesis